MDVSPITSAASTPSLQVSVPASTLQQQRASNLALLGWVMLSALKVVPTILYHTIVFVTITFPAWLYTLLSVTLTVTVNFSTLAILALGLFSTATYIFRYRYHRYGRAPPEIGRKEPGIEIPDPQASSKPGLSNYLDEFLSAIKVFGYLERYVG
jgi:lysophospholipid hydrolase